MAIIQRVRTEWTGLPGGPGLTTMYFDNVASAQVCIDAVEDFWGGLAGRISTPAVWTIQGDVDQVDDATGNIVGLASAIPRTGTPGDTGAMMSYGTQGLLNLRTGVYANGREIRGKVYIPVPSVNQNNDGVPTALYSAAIATAWGALLLTLAAGKPVVYSPTHNVSHPVATVNPSAYFARLRSRQR